MKTRNEIGSASSDAMKGGECMRTRIQFPGTIRKNGSSYYITVPGQYLAKMGLKEGDDIDLTISLPADNAEEVD